MDGTAHLLAATPLHLEVGDQRTSGVWFVLFRVERMDFLVQVDDAFHEGLARNGPKAVEELRKAFD
jgi:hypothetical protein